MYSPLSSFDLPIRYMKGWYHHGNTGVMTAPG